MPAYSDLKWDGFGGTAPGSERLSAKDAEIERLNGELKITIDVCNENTDLKKLITELADALDSINYGWPVNNEPLIERAREAVE